MASWRASRFSSTWTDSLIASWANPLALARQTPPRIAAHGTLMRHRDLIGRLFMASFQFPGCEEHPFPLARVGVRSDAKFAPTLCFVNHRRAELWGWVLNG